VERDAFKRTGMKERCLLGTMGLTERLIAALRHRVHLKLTPQLALLEGQGLRVDHDWYSIT
jgi:hypothetical protein